MNREEKHARDLARLEEALRISHERMAEAQKRIDMRFNRMRQKITGEYGEPSDAQQRIIAAALELLKEEGLASITLRKLATKVDMQAPALYWHFKDKEALVDYMAEAILQKELKELEPRSDSESWQEWLTEHMLRLRRAMLAYPDGARVVAGAHLYPAITLAKSLECGLISLNGDGVELKTARKIVTTATTYTFGYVIEEQSAPDEKEMNNFNLRAFFASYPYIAKAIGQEDLSQKAKDEDYLDGLRFIISGATK
jgi:TetR/AcrR family tetracycline transcriptional repressor